MAMTDVGGSSLLANGRSWFTWSDSWQPPGVQSASPNCLPLRFTTVL